MKERILRFLTGNTGTVLGIDIGTGSVKIAELARKSGRPVLKSVGIIDLPESMLQDDAHIDSTVLADTIRKAVTASGSSAHEAVVAVSSKAVFVRELIFPSMTPDELKEAIKWDVEKYVPYLPNSYYYDFSIIGNDKYGAELKVLLVAAPQAIVDNLFQAVKAAGLKLIAVDIESLAIFRTLGVADNVLVVDIGMAYSQVTIFDNGSPVLTRDIEVGGQRFTEEIMQALGLNFVEAERLKQRQEGLLKIPNSAEKAPLQQQMEMLLFELTREVRRTAEYYQMQHKSVSFDQLVITGGGAKLDNIIEHFKQQFEDMQISVHEPLAAIELNPSLDPEYVKKISSQLSIAVGLALYGGEL